MPLINIHSLNSFDLVEQHQKIEEELEESSNLSGKPVFYITLDDAIIEVSNEQESWKDELFVTQKPKQVKRNNKAYKIRKFKVDERAKSRKAPRNHHKKNIASNQTPINVKMGYKSTRPHTKHKSALQRPRLSFHINPNAMMDRVINRLKTSNTPYSIKNKNDILRRKAAEQAQKLRSKNEKYKHLFVGNFSTMRVSKSRRENINSKPLDNP